MAEKRIWSVGEVNRYIHSLMDDDHALADICVKGELSNVKYHPSGHVYFTLKDESSAISAVMFASDRYGLDFRLDPGDEVTVLGRVSVYEKSGTYQIYARSIKRSGTGELYIRFEELKRELSEMGMFDPMYKKPVPRYIKRLGVVTASTGAAVRDIINIAKRRNPYIEIILYPAIVQGRGAAESIACGIRCLEKKNVDTIIIGRGGGSIEDLWAFNERTVADAIFSCSIPVISGTGHETDTTIADFVADLRAPTPSAAAELAVFDLASFDGNVKNIRDSLNHLIDSRIMRYREEAAHLKTRIGMRSPEARLKVRRERLENCAIQLKRSMERILAEKKNREAVFAETLSALSPLNTLCRGYTFTETEAGVPVKSVRDVDQGDRLRIYTKDGRIYADVEKLEEREY